MGTRGCGDTEEHSDMGVWGHGGAQRHGDVEGYSDMEGDGDVRTWGHGDVDEHSDQGT